MVMVVPRTRVVVNILRFVTGVWRALIHIWAPGGVELVGCRRTVEASAVAAAVHSVAVVNSVAKDGDRAVRAPRRALGDGTFEAVELGHHIVLHHTERVVVVVAAVSADTH